MSGNEAVALAALDFGVALGTGYPGTPSTEILEHFSANGGRAQWAPNEKVALEVGLGAALGGAAALVTMKHVGLNVAADPLFTAAYTGTTGPLLVVSADDPGMASSQNEQDNRRIAFAAAVPMLEPADSQESYDFTLLGLELSARWNLPVILRTTTRVCHSKSVLCKVVGWDKQTGENRGTAVAAAPVCEVPPILGDLVPPYDRLQPRQGTADLPRFVRDVAARVMLPSNARPAHRRLRQKLAELAQWNDEHGPNETIAAGTVPISAGPPRSGEAKMGLSPSPPGGRLGIVTSGVAYMHVREAAPDASVLKLGLTFPLPLETIRRFAAGVDRCLVVEEGDPYLVEQLRAAGIAVEGKPDMYRFGELNVARVRRIIAGDLSPEPAAQAGKPPALCQGCPHRKVFDALKKLDCIVTGDIGCYSLGALAPWEAMDSLVCMGASIGMGLGLRHVLPADEARRVVSVLGDSTFVHSGIPGLVEMVYNPPPTGHVVLILDNGTTAMTGLQEHPGTGRKLDHGPADKLSFEDLARALGVPNVAVVDPVASPERFEQVLAESLNREVLSVIIARRTCVLAAGKIRKYEECAAPTATP